MKRITLALLAAAIVAAAARAGGDDPNPYAPTSTATAGIGRAVSVELVQGKGVVWWSRRAVQARKDANKRAHTIRVLRAALRARVDYAPRRGLESARAAGLTQALLCIHSYEAAWSPFNPHNPTHYGGLQMDEQFERTYGAEFYRAWGHAYNWPAFVQLTVAMRAYFSGRGFGPWPQTAHSCGLR